MLLLLILPYLSAQATDYKMPTLVLKDTLTEEKSLQEKELCHDHETQKNPDESEGFVATNVCEFECKNGNKKSAIIKKSFVPSNEGMRRGDGNLWASLSTTLKYWSEENCINEAATLCEGINQLKDVQVKEIRSGSWVMSGALACDENQKTILSPFEKSLKTEKQRFSSIKKPLVKNHLDGMNSDWRKKFKFTSRIGSDLTPESKNCRSVVTATFCYGDCISLEPGKEWTEHLASSKPLGKDSYTICMDGLQNKIKGKNLPSSVITHLCETEILSVLKAKSATGLSCASSRLQTTCDQLAGI